MRVMGWSLQEKGLQVKGKDFCGVLAVSRELDVAVWVGPGGPRGSAGVPEGRGGGGGG